jgi:hypothetical protein
MRKTLITLDYELYFDRSGTAQKCIIEPTDLLLGILDKHDVKATFFVDSGYVLKLKEYMHTFEKLQTDYQLIQTQVQKLSKEGHDVELHIHPHWEDSTFDGSKWVFDTSRYKLADFSEQQIDDIVFRYSQVIEEITSNKPTVFRSGGWCVQPFDKLAGALYRNGIRIDSTVYPMGENATPSKSFNFVKAPDKPNWKFSNDPLVEDYDGRFEEIPISSIKTTPVFYYKFILKKLFGTKIHKSFGDGSAIGNSKKQLYNLLTRSSYSVASIDGYKASLLHKCARQNKKQLVLIGHPKALTPYSIKKLDEFIDKTKSESVFRVYSNYNE